jgi:PAS domain S-box-containing protein
MAPKALVVDNDFFFVEFLSDLLTGREYLVVKAYDGKEAIGYLQTDSFDIIFLDMFMPKIDGGKVIEYVRSRFPAAAFPIVALSGAIIERVDELGEIGADYYIAKGPMEKMEAEINRFLSEFESTGNDSERTESSDKFFEPANLHPRQETAELIEAMEFHKSIMESLPAGVLVLDRDTRLIDANPKALRMLGFRIEHLLNMPLTSLFMDEDRPLLVDALKKSITAGEQDWLSVTARTGSIRFSLKPGLLRVDRETAGWVLVVEDERNG